MTSRLEVLGVVPAPGTAARQPVARQRGPDRRFLERRRSCPSPSQAGAPAVGVEQRHGVIVVTPVGTLPDPLPARLVEQLEASIAARPVIIDLSQTTLVSAAPVVGLTGWVLGASHQPDQCCVAIFGSVGDALQARRFADDGYGAGWHPDPPGRLTVAV